MLNYFNFRNHVVWLLSWLECMVFELLSCNLYEFLAINEFQGFELDLVRRFAI
jgi:dual specificity tyrosine-phosphorylation-regulated kinase 2/3/4